MYLAYNENIGFGRKVGQVAFHPTASNTVAAAGGDHVIKLWDIEAQADRSSLSGFTDSIQSIDFDWTGVTLAASCRDRKLRIFDSRAGGQPVQTADSHPGIKGSRIIWCGSTDRVATTGFSKTSDRQLWVWDSRSIKSPVKQTMIDTSSGVMMPFWSDNSIIFLAGKGDGNIRYYELDNDDLHPLSEYKSTEPQRGMAFLPRRDLNADDNEIARAYKLSNNVIQPISFICPRKADSFQADIFPPAPSAVPALSSQEFFSGKTATPNLVNLQDGSGVASSSVAAAPQRAAATPSPAATPAASKFEPSPSANTSAATSSLSPSPSPAAPAQSQSQPQEQRRGPLPEPSRAPKVEEPVAPSPAPSRNLTPSAAREPEAKSTAFPRSGPSSSSASLTSGIGDVSVLGANGTQTSLLTANLPSLQLATELQKLTTESAARDARLRELELENEKLKTDHHRLRENGSASSGSGTATDFSADRFFETQSPPANLKDFSELAKEFVDRHHKQGRKVVLVTVNNSDARVVDELAFEP